MILLKGKFVENERGARNVLSVHAENMRRSVLQICGSSFNRFALFCCGDLRHSVGVICGVWRSDLRYFTEVICGKVREQQISGCRSAAAGGSVFFGFELFAGFGFRQCSLQLTGKPIFVAVFIDVPKIIKQLFLCVVKLIHKIIIAHESGNGNSCPIKSQKGSLMLISKDYYVKQRFLIRIHKIIYPSP